MKGSRNNRNPSTSKIIEHNNNFSAITGDGALLPALTRREAGVAAGFVILTRLKRMATHTWSRATSSDLSNPASDTQFQLHERLRSVTILEVDLG